jgi:pimeloyl-ACP methyl ester carboxylesterase
MDPRLGGEARSLVRHAEGGNRAVPPACRAARRWARGRRPGASGVAEQDGRFRVAMDPAAPEVGSPPTEDLLARSSAAVRLACGEHDELTSVAELRQFDPEAVELSGQGHNAHVEDPEAVWRLIPTP